MHWQPPSLLQPAHKPGHAHKLGQSVTLAAIDQNALPHAFRPDTAEVACTWPTMLRSSRSTTSRGVRSDRGSSACYVDLRHVQRLSSISLIHLPSQYQLQTALAVACCHAAIVVSFGTHLRRGGDDLMGRLQRQLCHCREAAHCATHCCTSHPFQQRRLSKR